MVQCPRCGTPIQPTWDWCHSCGFDPEGLKPVGWHASASLPGTGAPPPANLPPNFAAPPGAGGQSFGPMGYAPPVYLGPPQPKSKGAATAIGVIGAIGIAFVLLLVVLVGAVTLLGKNSSSKFSKIDSALPDITTPVTTAPLQWTAWSPPDGSFSIEFPGTPSPRVLDVDAELFSRTQFYEYDTASRTEFAIAVFDIRPELEITDTNLLLNDAAKGYAEGTKGTLGLFEPADFAGMPSARFIVAETNGAQHQAILLVAGKRIFIIAIGTPSDRVADAATFNHFLNSFHITA